MKLMQKFTFATIFTLFLFLSISFVSSAEITVTNLNDTNQIQTAISDTNNSIITFEGEFNNLTTLNINRDNIKISGNNAVITKNSSNNDDPILFNISSYNVIIENLKIVGYNTTIFSNSTDILIQNNHIDSYNSVINITKTDGIKNITIINNNISTTRAHAYGIYFDSKGDLVDTLISNNQITTRSTDAHGIYLRSNDDFGLFENITVSNNTINTGTGRGIYLYSSFGNMSENLIYGNNIFTTGATAHGIWIYANRTNMTNNSVFNNNIITTGNNARGISLYVNTGNGTNNTISNNNVTTKGKNTTNPYGSIFIYTFTHSLNNTIITGNNIIANSTAIYVGTGSARTAIINHLNISYNRVLSNNTFILVQKSGENITASANWFGNNTPNIGDTSKFFNISILDYYVVNASYVNNSGIVGGNWSIDYTFYLNNTSNVGEFLNLPVFMAELFNSSNIEIRQWLAYDTGYQEVNIDQPIVTELYIVLDNEEIQLGIFYADKGNTTLAIEVIGDLAINKTVTINGALKNIQGHVLKDKKVTLLVDGINITSNITDTNGSVSFTYTFNNSGTFTFQLVFEEDEFYYGNYSEIISCFVPKIDTDLGINVSGDIGINKTVIVSGILKVTDGKSLANENVTLLVNGVKVDVNLTDTNGFVFFNYTLNKIGNYTFKLEFYENEEYYNSSSNIERLSVTPMETQLTISYEGEAKLGKTIKIIANLSSKTSTSGEEIIFLVNGKEIGRNYTNSEGIAILYYTIPKIGKYEFSANFLGSELFESSSSPYIEILVKSNNNETNKSKNKTKNKTINSSDVYATMDNTGIPIISLILSLLTSLGFIIFRKF